MREVVIEKAKEAPIGISLDTIRKNKQAIVFCSSKRAAESQAEKIAKVVGMQEPIDFPAMKQLAEVALRALSSPTKQCKRLALCLEKGIAFHHAGLASKQRELIEDNFREGKIKVICSTPTLAAGLDMPAFRTIIRDVKRFGTYGMVNIPVLEYEQMAGRAGRPGKEDYGEAIIVAGKESDVESLMEQYVHGEVEDIYSKLAVEPVLRTYILSLVATGFINTSKQLEEFFSQTFYAQQYGNMDKLNATLHRIVRKLIEWKMLAGSNKEEQKEAKDSMFISGSQLLEEEEARVQEKLTATLLGQRVSDGLQVMEENKREASDKAQTFALAHLLSCALEMRPLLRVKTKEYDHILILKDSKEFFFDEEQYIDQFSDDFEDTIKTTQCLMDWMEESGEEGLLERYDVRPGELSVKLQKADWLLYACEELARVQKMQGIRSPIKHVRERMKHGAKSELLTLLHFKGIGRVRARKLFARNITGVSDVKKTSYEQLSSIVGKAMAGKLKEQVGEPVKEAEKEKKQDKTQHQLGDFT